MTKFIFVAVKIHVLGLPHTQTSERFTTCAFTQKVLNLCKMLHRRGHHVTHYGVEGLTAECTEHVSVVPQAMWEELYPHPGRNFYNLETGGKYAPYHQLWATTARKALRERTGSDLTEIICLTWGGTQRLAVEGINQFLVESGIGYKHSWAQWRVYESYAWMHMHLGADGAFDGGRWYWSVIPNAFDLTKFTPKEDVERSDSFVYLGRLNEDKGVGLAVHAAKEAGKRITLVGQGNPEPFLRGNPHASYIPPIGAEERLRLLTRARAVFCPSIYVEPFCGVNVEAQLCGTPVITSDHGAFPETVLHGVTGYRCRTFDQFLWAAKNIDRIDRNACTSWARANFSLERIALMYEEYFQMVLNVGGRRKKGFYEVHQDRTQLDWLVKSTPRVEPVDLTLTALASPDALADTATSDEWTDAQGFERDWWGLHWAPHWDDEIKKQESYFRLMGIADKRDFGDATILDVGCGPVSLLQRTKHGPSRGVDPLAISEETRTRYRDSNVELLSIQAEEMPLDRKFDEVWMYNCLQHTRDPHEILRRVEQLGDVVRIFEWVDLGVCPGHPQNLTEEMFWKHFGTGAWDRRIWNVGSLRDFGGTVTNKYIAIHAVRRPSASAPRVRVHAVVDDAAANEKQVA